MLEATEGKNDFYLKEHSIVGIPINKYMKRGGIHDDI